jgi:hypothetical protein
VVEEATREKSGGGVGVETENLVTNASGHGPGVHEPAAKFGWIAFSTGNLPDWVSPARKTFPEESTAIPFPWSSEIPPMKVEKEGVPFASRTVKNASIFPPPKVAWSAPT